MSKANLENILDDFMGAPPAASPLKNGRPVTIWLPADAKARYDRLQERSSRQFGKKAREALLKLIELAELKVG